MPRSGDFLAPAKSTTTQVAKFLLEELLGSKISQSFGFGVDQPAAEVRTPYVLHGQDQNGREVTLELLEIVDG